MKKPWLNPPADDELGAKRGGWALTLTVITLAVVAVLVVLILVQQDRISEWWTYAVLPVAIIAAAATRVLTVLKASGESKGNT